jgi:hypothetical protein
MELIETVKKLKVITSSQIQRLFYSHKESQCRRCKQLVNNKKIKCYREGFGSEMIYYYKRKPTQQIKSMLTISEMYVQIYELSKELGFDILDFQREYSIEIEPNFTIRPDAYLLISKDGIESEFFIEVDNTKDFSSDKYFKAMKLGYFPPPIISVSNRKRIIYEGMDVIKIKFDLSNFKSIFPSLV